MVKDCCLLHSHSRKSMRVPFCESDVFDMVWISDREMDGSTVGLKNISEDDNLSCDIKEVDGQDDEQADKDN